VDFFAAVAIAAYRVQRRSITRNGWANGWVCATFDQGDGGAIRARRSRTVPVVGVMKAIEYHAKIIAAASTGNAASSLGVFRGGSRLPAVIFVPEKAPEPKIAQLLGVRATGESSKRDVRRGVRIFCMDACAKSAGNNRIARSIHIWSKARKTCGLEKSPTVQRHDARLGVPQCGRWLYDRGCMEGIREMFHLGFIKKLPRMLGVQAAGCKPV